MYNDKDCWNSRKTLNVQYFPSFVSPSVSPPTSVFSFAFLFAYPSRVGRKETLIIRQWHLVEGNKTRLSSAILTRRKTKQQRTLFK